MASCTCLTVHYWFNGALGRYQKSGGRQCKSVPIPGLRVLVHPIKHGRFLLTTSQLKSPNGQNMRETCIISSDFLLVPNILSFPSILCVVKQDLGYKVSSPKHGSSPQRVAIKVCKWTKIWGQKLIVSSDLVCF